MYGCMYVCMYIYIYIYIHTYVGDIVVQRRDGAAAHQQHEGQGQQEETSYHIIS